MAAPRDPYGRERRYQQAIAWMRRGLTKTQATRRAGITRQGFEAINLEQQDAVAVRRGGRVHHWRLRTEEERRIHLPAPVFEYDATGAPTMPPQVGWGERMGSQAGELWHALADGNVRVLRDFAGRVLVDSEGRRYRVPDVDTMLAWWNGRTDEFGEEFWRLFESGTSQKRSAGGGRRAA
jgi:hypothetical protein